MNNLNKVANKIEAKYKSASKVKGVLLEIKRILDPYVGPIFRLIKSIWIWYKYNIYQKYAYDEDVPGVKEHSSKRGAVTVLSTIGMLVFIYFAFLPTLGFLFKLGGDAWMVANAEPETLYFSKPVLNSETNQYEVVGCSSVDNCRGGENARIFDIPDNLALDIWSYMKFEGGYEPKDMVVSSFAGEMNECAVIRYRAGTTKLGPLIWHSQIISANCRILSN